MVFMTLYMCEYLYVIIINVLLCTDVAENDCDAECRSLAVQSLILLDKNLKSQLQIPDTET